jgi:histidinol dehydrogenase
MSWTEARCENGAVTSSDGVFGGAIVFPDEESAVESISAIPIEHLVLDVADPHSIVERIRYAGEIIVGPNTPIGACTFVCGPNAVLTTSGFSRSMSGGAG